MRSFLLLSLLALAGCAPSAPDVRVTDAWARATAPGQGSGAVYATISNDGGNDRLIGVHTPVGMAMLHANEQSGAVARMRMLSDLSIPPRGSVTLAPGGTHVMISGLKAPLTAGTHIPVTFRFAASGERTVDASVVPAGAR